MFLSRARGNTNRALTIKFHRIASAEVEAARRIARVAGTEEHRFVSVPQLRELGDIPVRRSWFKSLPESYIPMKNAVYYSLAAAYAEETEAALLVGGHNKDDLRLYDDTSDRFFRRLQSALRAGSSRLEESGLTIWRPLRRFTKPEVIRLAERLGVPLERTWSCHREGKAHCWECAGCVGRVHAFRQAGLRDPLAESH